MTNEQSRYWKFHMNQQQLGNKTWPRSCKVNWCSEMLFKGIEEFIAWYRATVDWKKRKTGPNLISNNFNGSKLNFLVCFPVSTIIKIIFKSETLSLFVRCLCQVVESCSGVTTSTHRLFSMSTSTRSVCNRIWVFWSFLKLKISCSSFRVGDNFVSSMPGK